VQLFLPTTFTISHPHCPTENYKISDITAVEQLIFLVMLTHAINYIKCTLAR